MISVNFKKSHFDLCLLYGVYRNMSKGVQHVFQSHWNSTVLVTLYTYVNFLGPQVPFTVKDSVMITHPMGQGVILLGGHTHNRRNSNMLLELSGHSLNTLSWRIMGYNMKFQRSCHLAFPIPDELVIPPRRLAPEPVPVKDFTGAHVCCGLILAVPVLLLFFKLWIPLISKLFSWHINYCTAALTKWSVLKNKLVHAL